MNIIHYALPFFMLMSFDIGGKDEPLNTYIDIPPAPTIYKYEAKIPTNCNPFMAELFNLNTFTKPQSTNTLYPDLITPCDDSDFLYLTPEEHTINHYIFTAHFPEDVTFTIAVDQSFTYTEAVQQATTYGRTMGQIPFLLRFNFERLILKPGDGHPYSGKEIQTYTELRINAWGVKEENLMHDLAHASLNGADGLLNRREWLAAMRQDGTSPSLYAKNYYDSYQEDAPEVIIYYLVSRWRPERFDPKLVEFINNRFANRFAILDTLEWNFNN